MFLLISNIFFYTLIMNFIITLFEKYNFLFIVICKYIRKIFFIFNLIIYNVKQ